MILVKNKLKKLKNKYEDDEMLKQLKYSPPIDDNFDFILDDTEYEDTATQFPDITNNFTQTIKKDMADKETDTYDELNKIIGAYILQVNSKNFKSKEVSRGELLAVARTVPVQKNDEERSSSSSNSSEGFLGRNVRRGIRLAEIAGNASLMTLSALDTATTLTLDGMMALHNLVNQQNEDDEEEEQHQEIPSGSNEIPTFTRERSRSRDTDTDSDDTDDDALADASRANRDTLGGRLLRRGASRSRSSTPEKRDKHPKGKK